jgi:hypothetical protein
VSLFFFLDLLINLFMSPNLFSWVPYLSKSLQDFSRNFSELRVIFRGLKDNSRFSRIIFIRGIKIIPKLRNFEKFSNPRPIYIYVGVALDALDSEVQSLSRAAVRSCLYPSPNFFHLQLAFRRTCGDGSASFSDHLGHLRWIPLPLRGLSRRPLHRHIFIFANPLSVRRLPNASLFSGEELPWPASSPTSPVNSACCAAADGPHPPHHAARSARLSPSPRSLCAPARLRGAAAPSPSLTAQPRPWAPSQPSPAPPLLSWPAPPRCPASPAEPVPGPSVTCSSSSTRQGHHVMSWWEENQSRRWQ